MVLDERVRREDEPAEEVVPHLTDYSTRPGTRSGNDPTVGPGTTAGAKASTARYDDRDAATPPTKGEREPATPETTTTTANKNENPGTHRGSSSAYACDLDHLGRPKELNLRGAAGNLMLNRHGNRS